MGVMSVLLGADAHDDDEEVPRWRLIVIEDADELLRADAKRTTGQSLSRLSNLADGFIGRGRRTLVMITTNEALGWLHPALLGPGQAGDRDLTLAEVFERRGELVRLSSQAAPGGTGQYL